MLSKPFIIIGFISLITDHIFGQYNTNFYPNRSGIVHLFEWKFTDVANECENFLGPKGFGGVQLSPINENLIVNTDDARRPWWERYQPMSYKILTRSGNEEDFLNMSKRCNSANIRIYVEIVINHMAATYFGNMTGTAGSIANGTELFFPGVPYGKDEFHKDCNLTNFLDAHEIRNCRFQELPDLDQSYESVQSKIIDYMNHLIDFGVAGFYVNAAKHMWPIDLKTIFEEVNNLSTKYDFPEETRPFFYQEVIDTGGEAISKIEYIGIGVVTEFLYSAEISNIFNGLAPLSTLINWGPTMGFIPHSTALVFVDNHDSQRYITNNILTYKNEKQYTMAVAFMLAHPYGIPRVMSSYHFNSTNQGPPSDEEDTILSPEFNENGQCDEDFWICEHRWNAIANMIEFRNVANNENIINWQDTGPNQIAFCRGNKGFIAFNNDPNIDYITSVFGCLGEGEYCDIISGSLVDNNCTGKIFTIDENGKLNISIPSENDHGVIAIHVKSKLK